MDQIKKFLMKKIILKKMKTLSDKIDTTRMSAPSFLMVLVGVGKYAYRREDGVYVVPIGALRP